MRDWVVGSSMPPEVEKPPGGGLWWWLMRMGHVSSGAGVA